MRINNHLIADIKFLESPNFNTRPKGTSINLLVIHSISLPPKVYGNNHIENFFLNKLDYSLDPFYEQIKELKVSTHLLIKRDGEIIQFVPFNMRAWHAGESSFDGKDNCNDYSIGIELEGADDDDFEEIQYDKLCAVTIALQDEYKNITKENIKGHSDIAPGRKTDPGLYFKWDKYLDSL